MEPSSGSVKDFVLPYKIGGDFGEKKSRGFSFPFGKKSSSKGIPIKTSVKSSNKPLPKTPAVPSLTKIPLAVQPPNMDAHTHSIIGHVAELRKLEKPEEEQQNESTTSSDKKVKALTEENKARALTANGFKADCLMKKESLDKAWHDGTLMQKIQAWPGPVIIAVGKPGAKTLYTYLKDDQGKPWLCHCESGNPDDHKLTVKNPVQVCPTALLNNFAASKTAGYAIELYRIEKTQAPLPLYIDLTESQDKGKKKDSDEENIEEHNEEQEKLQKDYLARLGIDEKNAAALGFEFVKEDTSNSQDI